jgi:hypothetical protein
MLCINKYIIQYPEYTFARGSSMLEFVKPNMGAHCMG